jgi:hypothetical protein
MIGAFDHPEELAPRVQWGIEEKLPYVDGLHELPGYTTMDDTDDTPYLSDLVSYQHPDYDTDRWPPEDKT